MPTYVINADISIKRLQDLLERAHAGKDTRFCITAETPIVHMEIIARSKALRLELEIAPDVPEILYITLAKTIEAGGLVVVPSYMSIEGMREIGTSMQPDTILQLSESAPFDLIKVAKESISSEVTLRLSPRSPEPESEGSPQEPPRQPQGTFFSKLPEQSILARRKKRREKLDSDLRDLAVEGLLLLRGTTAL